MAKLRYNFTFPFRWLKEDRKYLKKNLTKSVPLHNNKEIMHRTLMDDEPPVYSYGVRLTTHAYQPKPYKMTKEEMTELLSDVFPDAKCRAFEKYFKQINSRTILPKMEMEIYY